MMYLYFESCMYYPDLWVHAYTRADGTKYYECVLLYVDNFLVISDEAEDILQNYIRIYF